MGPGPLELFPFVVLAILMAMAGGISEHMLTSWSRLKTFTIYVQVLSVFMTGHKVLKLFSCSTQLSTVLSANKCENAKDFHIYLQEKNQAQLR